MNPNSLGLAVANLDLQLDGASGDVEAKTVLVGSAGDESVVALAAGVDCRAGAAVADLAAGDIQVLGSGDEGRAVGAGPAAVAVAAEVELDPGAGPLAKRGLGHGVGGECAEALGVGVDRDGLCFAGGEGEGQSAVPEAIDETCWSDLVTARDLVGHIGDVGVDRGVVVLGGDAVIDGHDVASPVACYADITGGSDVRKGCALALGAAAEGHKGSGRGGGCSRDGSGGGRGYSGSSGSLGDGDGGGDGSRRRELAVDGLVEGRLALLMDGAVEMRVAGRVGNGAEGTSQNEDIGELHLVDDSCGCCEIEV